MNERFGQDDDRSFGGIEDDGRRFRNGSAGRKVAVMEKDFARAGFENRRQRPLNKF